MYFIAQIGPGARVMLRGTIRVTALAGDMGDIGIVSFFIPFPSKAHLVTITRGDTYIGFAGVFTAAISIDQAFDTSFVSFDAKRKRAAARRCAIDASMIAAARFSPITKDAIITIGIGAAHPTTIAGFIANGGARRTR